MKEIEKLKEQYPLINKLIATEEVFWMNPNMEKYEMAIIDSPLNEENVQDAEERLKRFAPYIAKVFPETKETGGIIESPLVKIPSMKRSLEKNYGQPILGELLLKCDSQLPISGSIKARGGIYEVLKHAEQLALQHGMLTEEDNYSILDSDTCREFLQNTQLR